MAKELEEPLILSNPRCVEIAAEEGIDPDRLKECLGYLGFILGPHGGAAEQWPNGQPLLVGPWSFQADSEKS